MWAGALLRDALIFVKRVNETHSNLAEANEHDQDTDKAYDLTEDESMSRSL